MTDVLIAPAPRPVKLAQEARRIASAFSNGRRKPPFDADQLELWINAADWLIERGELSAAQRALRALQKGKPGLEWAVNLADLLDRAPPLESGACDFADNLRSDIQVKPRPGADTALVLFCDGRHRLGMPLPLIDRWLSRTGASLIYLRDFQGLCYLKGVASLGEDLAATKAALLQMLDRLGARRVVCLGCSGGGYGALFYALELGCDAVLLGSPVTMEPDFNIHMNYSAHAQQMKAAFPDHDLDLRRRFEASEPPPRTLIVYGGHNWNERIHAEHMAGAPGAAVYPMAGYRGHTTAAELIRRGQLQPLLAGFLTARPVVQSEAARP